MLLSGKSVTFADNEAVSLICSFIVLWKMMNKGYEVTPKSWTLN